MFITQNRSSNNKMKISLYNNTNKIGRDDINQQKKNTIINLAKHNGNHVPRNIFQTWHTKVLPPLMRICVDKLIQLNPLFEHHLFDDNDCREFIKRHFKEFVLISYDSLIPGAYKADLWRYCVLYVHGGIYIDIKYSCIGNNILEDIIYTEHYVKDTSPNNIYNAFLVCHKKNPLMLSCIHQIVNNVASRYYGHNALYPTGPYLLGTKLPLYINPMYVDMVHYTHGTDKYIYYNNKPFLKMYNDYYTEHNNYKKVLRYDELWNARMIYKKIQKNTK